MQNDNLLDQDEAFAALQIEAGKILPAHKSFDPELKDCLFGVPADNHLRSGRRVPLQQIPSSVAGFGFYMSDHNLELARALVRTKLPQQLKTLHVGGTTFSHSLDLSAYQTESRGEYRNLIEELSQVDFPQLESLCLGVYELYCNDGTIYYPIGDVTRILQKVPVVQQLWLCGHFELTQCGVFPELTELNVEMEDEWYPEVPPLSQASLDNLLQSELPKLDELYINLASASLSPTYEIPSDLSGANVPSLRKLEIVGCFSADTAKDFSESPLANRSNSIARLTRLDPTGDEIEKVVVDSR